jgi:hypothetical protein
MAFAAAREILLVFHPPQIRHHWEIGRPIWQETVSLVVRFETESIRWHMASMLMNGQDAAMRNPSQTQLVNANEIKQRFRDIGR